MLTIEQARERVAKGAAHLDATRPGWHDRIDVGTLTLHDPCGCIVGQLMPNTTFTNFNQRARVLFPISVDEQAWRWGVDASGRDASGDNHEWATTEEYRGAFTILQDAWVEAIADRRLAGRARLLGTDTSPASEAEARPPCLVTA